MPSNPVIQKLVKAKRVAERLDAEAEDRIQRIYNGGTKVQQDGWDDESRYRSVRCPRRSGKSFFITGDALLTGEKIPFARILIISITLKSTKENFWSGPGGIKHQNDLYKLGLEYNQTDVVWMHPNGSRGRLAGAETRADIEYLRGAAAEADIVYIDECKSFAPELLRELIRDIIQPGLMTRGGRLVLAGTPGNIPEGDFYLATQPRIKHNPKDPKSKNTCYTYKGKSRIDRIWSLHTWTIQDNTAKPQQWADALAFKADYNIDDDDPRWRREYLGEWVTDIKELVYAFAKCRMLGKCTWVPVPTKENPYGISIALGICHLIMGLDFGYEDDNAIVLAVYSESIQELRHIYDFSRNHMTIDEFGAEILLTISIYGMPDVIVGDQGSLGGVLYLQELQTRFGLAIVPAEKREKYDHFELMNSDFYADRIKVIEGSALAHQLSHLQWDLSKESKLMLTRKGKLREDPSCPNHLCDAFLYLWRYCYHYWATPESKGLEPGTPQWWKEQERKSVERYIERHSTSSENDLDKYRQRDILNIYSMVGDEYDFT
jgi:hypothetical protein